MSEYKPRRKCCDICLDFIENYGETHKCSDRKLRALERKEARITEQEVHDLIYPEQPYDDRLKEAERMINIEKTDTDDYRAFMEYFTTQLYVKEEFENL